MRDPFPAEWFGRIWHRVPTRIMRVASAAEVAATSWLALAIRLFAVRMLVGPLAHDMMLGSAGPFGDGLGAAASSQAGLTIRAGALVALGLGVATRPAALVAIAASWLLPARADHALPLWSVLLAWIAITGPGTISIDRLLKRGTDSVAIPGATKVRIMLEKVSRHGSAVSLLGLRLWLAAMLAAVALPTLATMSGRIVLCSMRPMATILPEPLLLVAALLMLAGVLTRSVALARLIHGAVHDGLAGVS